MRKLLALLFLFICLGAHAQIRFSIASDISLMRNFSPHQKFWALGQTVRGNFHFSKKETAYAWISYYTPGKFSNYFWANARSLNTSPGILRFKANGNWRSNEVSLGWKHYFRGSYDGESNWSLYSIAGFGLMFTKVENQFTPAVDTSFYKTPLLPGKSEFKRLTLDLGAGVEFPLGASFFIYADARTWIPTSDYPSPYLHNTKNVPLPFMMSGGLRILFGY